ncbi:MAG: chalcone isomerase family protein [Limnohabitans sp.]|nr:chalcone isomerase family protein [Limnohabitans sp.]
MKKLILTLLMLSSFSVLFAQEKVELEGVTMPRTISYNGKKVQLNGFGVRSKMWMDVYVQALYLTNLSQDATYILDSETAMAIRVEIISSLVTSKKLSKALNKGLIKSVGGEENLRPIQASVTKLDELMNLEPTRQNDVFILGYNPEDSSIMIYKNDVLRGKINGGKEFKKAFFGIWLSPDPVDKDLKNDLLGIGN